MQLWPRLVDASFNNLAQATLGCATVCFNDSGRRVPLMAQRGSTSFSVLTDGSLIQGVRKQTDNIVLILNDVVER
ncbi:MAG: hypothetical protein CL801_04825 [Citromicrobium sp.]|nr:hypothetical protein [Citromicrobium sp.]